MSTDNQHEDRWLCRQSTHDLGSRKETANIRQTSELVWGHWVHPQSKHGNPRIVGESYHELHGPTACASISAYAEDLNMRGVKPSDALRGRWRLQEAQERSESDRVRDDGRTGFQAGEKESVGLLLTNHAYNAYNCEHDEYQNKVRQMRRNREGRESRDDWINPSQDPKSIRPQPKGRRGPDGRFCGLRERSGAWQAQLEPSDCRAVRSSVADFEPEQAAMTLRAFQFRWFRSGNHAQLMRNACSDTARDLLVSASESEGSYRDSLIEEATEYAYASKIWEAIHKCWLNSGVYANAFERP